MSFVNSRQEFDTPAEALAHFGVKGMKWGVRKTQGTRDFHAANPTMGSRRAAIKTARASVRATKKAERKETDPTKKADLAKIHVNNPDRATALRMTAGEKFIAAMVVGVGTPTGLIPTAVAATTAYRVGRRRSIEK